MPVRDELRPAASVQSSSPKLRLTLSAHSRQATQAQLHREIRHMRLKLRRSSQRDEQGANHMRARTRDAGSPLPLLLKPAANAVLYGGGWHFAPAAKPPSPRAFRRGSPVKATSPNSDTDVEVRLCCCCGSEFVCEDFASGRWRHVTNRTAPARETAEHTNAKPSTPGFTLVPLRVDYSSSAPTDFVALFSGSSVLSRTDPSLSQSRL